MMQRKKEIEEKKEVKGTSFKQILNVPLSSISSFFSLSLPPPAAWFNLLLMPERNPPLSFLWSVDDDCSFCWPWPWPPVNLLTKSIVCLFCFVYLFIGFGDLSLKIGMRIEVQKIWGVMLMEW